MESETIVRKYLMSFQERNIEELGTYFSSSVILRDWEQSATGINAVMEANSKIFAAFKEIKVEIINIIKSSYKVSVEFNLYLKSDIEDISLLVVDIIEFDNEMKITSVRAYRGN